jgi:hypothetical protein
MTRPSRNEIESTLDDLADAADPEALDVQVVDVSDPEETDRPDDAVVAADFTG